MYFVELCKRSALTNTTSVMSHDGTYPGGGGGGGDRGGRACPWPRPSSSFFAAPGRNVETARPARRPRPGRQQACADARGCGLGGSSGGDNRGGAFLLLRRRGRGRGEQPPLASPPLASSASIAGRPPAGADAQQSASSPPLPPPQPSYPSYDSQRAQASRRKNDSCSAETMRR